MRVPGIALALATLLSLYTGANGVPREFAPYRLLQTRFYDGRYHVQFHRNTKRQDVLMALDHKRMNLVTFDLEKVRPLNEEKLVERGQPAPDLVKTLSARTGEFWITFVRERKNGTRDIELHSDARIEYFAIEDSGMPLSLDLVEVGNEIILVAVYPQLISVYSRHGGRLTKITERAAPALIRQAQAFATPQGSLVIVTMGSDQKLRVYDADEAFRSLEQRWARPVKASYVEAELESDDNLIFGLVSGSDHGDTVRILRENGKQMTPPIAVDLNLGRIRWLRSQNGSLRLAAVSSQDGKTRIHLIYPNGQSQSVPAGDARTVSDLATFNVGPNEYLIYLKDNRDVYLQGENATSVIRPPEGARTVRISPLGRVDNQDSIAIMTDYKRSTQVQIIGFARARSDKLKKSSLLRTAGNSAANR
jgi:hypothetical protein